MTAKTNEPARPAVFAQAIASRRERVQKMLTQARATLDRLRDERVDVLQGMGKDPTKTPDMLDDIGVEIAAAERRVADLEQSLEIAEEYDSADSRMARRLAVRAHRESLQEKAARRIKLAAEIDKNFINLRKNIADWLALGELMAGDLKIVTTTAVEDLRLRQSHMGTFEIPSLAQGTATLFGAAIVEQLARTGLFRDGNIPHPSSISPDLNVYNMRGGISMEQAAAIASDKLAGVLDRFEALADASLGVLES